MNLTVDFLNSAHAGLSLQSSSGCMPAGHAGPHNYEETPVRNTSHWLVTYLKAFELTRERAFKDAASGAAEYLLSAEARPHGFSFVNRSVPGKDSCNGLIGQAWTIAALAEASRVLADDRYAAVARDVFTQHTFVPHRALWMILDIDGQNHPISTTLNQQIWFAQAGHALLQVTSGKPQTDTIRSSLDIFESGLPKYLKLRNDGIFYHLIMRRRDAYLRSLRHAIGIHSHWQEIGYHAFTLLGLTSIMQTMTAERQRPFAPALLAALKPLQQAQFLRQAEADKFAFSYNPTGFEVANILLSEPVQRLLSAQQPQLKQQAQVWIDRQIEKHYDSKSKLMTRNTNDPNVLAARMCQASTLVQSPLPATFELQSN